MPDWLLAPICLIVLVGFLWFAFRQGLKVKPDRENRDNWDRFGGPPDSHPGSPSWELGRCGSIADIRLLANQWDFRSRRSLNLRPTRYPTDAMAKIGGSANTAE
ncbi:hypothetical protein XH89_29770 [Bradyrhizobium sp. CCBAU 53340]|nr:hypothetical protein XH89_29770 [Bradyrhizobium sp. CCBAU 53340]